MMSVNTSFTQSSNQSGAAEDVGPRVDAEVKMVEGLRHTHVYLQLFVL